MMQKNRESRQQLDRPISRVKRQTTRKSVSFDRYATVALQLDHLIEKDESAPVIGITSADHNEGKTESAMMLGFAFASILEYRVLIIDGDLRHSALYQYLQVNKSPGLTDLLSTRVSIEDVISRTSVNRLYVMSSGTPVGNPLALLASKRLQSLVRHLSTQFDVIIFDMPPVLGYQDVSLLSRLLDGIAVIVKSG